MLLPFNDGNVSEKRNVDRKIHSLSMQCIVQCNQQLILASVWAMSTSANIEMIWWTQGADSYKALPFVPMI